MTSNNARASNGRDAAPVYSVVAPVYNEGQTLPEFHRRMVAVMESQGEPFEIVLVNDGSRDNSLQVMHELRKHDPRVKVLNFSRNFGHQVAITAGMDYAQGSAVVVIDSDLQDPPEVIPEMIAAWKDGADVVYGVREQREGETWFKLTTAKLFYRLIDRITSITIPVDTGDFRLMDRRVIDVMKELREHHRFMRGLSAWTGFRQTGVKYKRQPRYAGSTNYPLRKMVKLAWDAITSFSFAPLQLATSVGFIIAFLALLGILVSIILRLFGHAIVGQATTLISVLFLGGIQLIFLGIIGEYLGRIYDEVKRRPLYIVADSEGFGAADLERTPRPETPTHIATPRA
ncbi:MAG: glycosyltransferase family 2 protein [Anaerolineae bacterium]